MTRRIAGHRRQRPGDRVTDHDQQVPQVRQVEIRDQVIRLGQFLKLADLVESGADAKPLIAEGHVRVNDTVETRRGAQLRVGDVVQLGDQRVAVSGP